MRVECRGLRQSSTAAVDLSHGLIFNLKKASAAEGWDLSLGCPSSIKLTLHVANNAAGVFKFTPVFF